MEDVIGRSERSQHTRSLKGDGYKEQECYFKLSKLF